MKAALFLMIFIFIFSLSQVNAEVSVTGLSPLKSSPNFIQNADFNGDGIPDTAIIGTLSTVMARGLYSWDISLTNPSSSSIIDANENGKLDEVVIVGDGIVVAGKNGVLWRIPDKRGYSVASFDYNGDGYKDDFVVGGWDSIYAVNSAHNIVWRYNNVNGAVKYIDVVGNNIIAGVRDQLIILSKSGGYIRKLRLPSYIGAMTAFDFKNSGSPSGVVVVTLDGSVEAYDSHGNSQGWNFQNRIGSDDSEKVAVISIDRDSTGYDNSVVVLLKRRVYWFSRNGSYQKLPDVFVDDISKVDLDGDGILDDLVLGKEDSRTGDGEVIFVNGKNIILGNSSEIGIGEITGIDYDGDGIASEAMGINNYLTQMVLIRANLSDKTTSAGKKVALPPQTEKVEKPYNESFNNLIINNKINNKKSLPMKVSISGNNSVLSGENITLCAEVIPESSEVNTYIWREGSIILNTNISSSCLTKTFTQGNHTIVLQITDGHGNVAKASAIIIVNNRKDGSKVRASRDINFPVPEGKNENKSGWKFPSFSWKIIVIPLLILVLYLLKRKIEDFISERRYGWMK